VSNDEDWDDDDRAIARALDPSAAGDVNADRQRVDEYREVLGHLGPEVTPRPGLEDDVVAAALARRPAASPSVDRGRRRRANRVRVAVLAAAVVASVFIAGLIISEQSTGTPAPSAHVTLATVRRADVTALLRAPGTRRGVFRPVLPTRGLVVLGANGKGFVYQLRTDALVSLGLVNNDGSTVIGPTRAVNGAIGFVVDHPERVMAVDLIRNGETVARAQLTSR
jgi:hypothetical protein